MIVIVCEKCGHANTSESVPTVCMRCFEPLLTTYEPKPTVEGITKKYIRRFADAWKKLGGS
jgi:hypothetical protein